MLARAGKTGEDLSVRAEGSSDVRADRRVSKDCPGLPSFENGAFGRFHDWNSGRLWLIMPGINFGHVLHSEIHMDQNHRDVWLGASEVGSLAGHFSLARLLARGVSKLVLRLMLRSACDVCRGGGVSF